MSCFRATQTQMTDQECIVDALKTMGYDPQVNEEKVKVRGHGSETKKAEIILRKEDLKDGGDIGFNKTADGSYSIVGDSYVLHKNNMDKLNKTLKVTYAEAKVRKIAKSKNLWFNGFKEYTNSEGMKIRQLQFRPLGV